MISVPRGERSNMVIEPRLSHQWYVKTKEMAAKANDAVNKKEVVFHPENWIKTYFNWMDNIQDWCISRQIWWGHRIPAWHDDEGNVYVGYDENELREFYKLDNRRLTQDEDVLDTWFSSSLWPLALWVGHKKQQHLKLTFQHLYWLLGLILSFLGSKNDDDEFRIHWKNSF